jgi:uncharacterized protein (TIGR02145 family)
MKHFAFFAALLWVSTVTAQNPFAHEWSRLYGDSNEEFGKITAVNGEYFCAAAYSYNTGASDHIFTSADLETWTDLSVTLPSPPHIAFGSSLSGELFVSTSHEGFFASTNGVDWTSKFASGYGCASNGWESTDDGVHFTGVGGFLRGMHISYDDGATWSNMFPGYDFHGIEWLNTTDTVFAVTYQGLFVSVDLGQTWSQTSIPNVNSGYADVQEVAGEIFVLEKDGDIWSLSNGVWVLRHSLSVSNLLMHQGDCFYSTHAGGYVWSNLELGLLLSRDEGDTWEVISSPVDGYLFGAFENDNRLVATTADGIWEISFGPIQGCTDASACNYAEAASLDDGSCDYSCCPGPGCCHAGTVWDISLQQCVVAEPAYLNEPGETAVLNPCYFDSDDDGLVDVNDLMNLLTVYNLVCGEIPETTASWQCGDPLEYQGYDYETVQIGEQCWFAENLMAQNYRDGLPISEVNDCPTWSGITEGAYCSYENQTDHSNVHGLLYNWFVTDDALGVCPSGWHVPTDSEWMALEIEIGMSESAANGTFLRGTTEGDELKSATTWNGMDAHGFNSLPSGWRAPYNGCDFVSSNESTYYWSSTPSGSLAIGRGLTSVESGIWRMTTYQLRNGFSIRCIQDTE